MKNQIPLFDGKRLQMDESIELTIQSLITYCGRYDHWAMAWSGGKDSSTLLTLVIYLIESGKVPKPKSLTIYYADTRLELTPLSIAAYNIIEQLKEKGYEVEVVMAEMDKRFMVYMLGRGVPPPNNKTLRWCTGQIKIEPMKAALAKLYEKRGKVLMLTGVRQGESAIRDNRIVMSCSKDGAECGQGWYQESLPEAMCDTLAPLLHWRVCHIWEWLRHWAPLPEYGDWDTEIIADAYGGDEAEEVNARTGCIGCPLAQKDTALEAVIKMSRWTYLKPLQELRSIYEWLRLPINRHRKNGERNKDGKLSSNPQRLGPIKLLIRVEALNKILDIQNRVNAIAKEEGRPLIDIINPDEEIRILDLIRNKTFPNKWDGSEIGGEVPVDKIYSNGTMMETLFKNWEAEDEENRIDAYKNHNQ
jgi:DNA sulfur modification protein DndC